MKFLPFLSPIFKTIRATTTRYLPIGAWHATRFAMKQYLPEGRQARKQIAQFIQEQW